MNRVFSPLIVFSLASLAALMRGDEEACIPCGGQVHVDGQFAHYRARYDNSATIQGEAHGKEAAFAEDIAGTHFTVTVSHLPAGRYTIVIGEVETDADDAGQRLFNVTSGDNVIASHFDIFSSAGGANRVCSITGHVEHADDATGGPLTVTFTALKDNAKFNTLEVRDASGAAVVSLDASDLADAFSIAASQPPKATGPEVWKDPDQPVDARVNDLIRRMSLAEKVEEIRNATPAIPRLGIHAYNFWSEALHGVAAAGIATVFPQAIGMAATWDPKLIHDEADVISTEGRAKFNDYAGKHQGDSAARFFGLTFWSPNVNIFRDPRWGRGQETYGEDPFLTGILAVAFIQGLQGDDPRFLKAMACAKHFAVHSGPEPGRSHFNAQPPERDLYETYLPQFETAVREGHVGGVMGSYNAVNGIPACASALLLGEILRKKWGFDGYIVSDCGAIHGIYAEHKFVATPEEGAAVAVSAGCDICCGEDYDALVRAVEKGLVTETEVDRALAYALKARFRLGLFDSPDRVPFSKIGIDQNDTPAHEALALKVAEESIVLLKNVGVLPLDRAKIKRIAVIGENANSVPVLVGNYNGTPARPVTILDGVKSVGGPGIEVTYETSPLALRKDGKDQPASEVTDRAVAAAQAADVVVYVGGISAQFEGEENERANDFDGFNGGDRTRIELPSVQTELLKALHATGKPIIFVNCSGSAIAMPWAAENLPAIVQAWYPGEQGGRAVAEVLFGEVNPVGRLPITFYRSTDDLPPFQDYRMRNRTYRYFDNVPLFAFGHGLSYTKFDYTGAKIGASILGPDDTVRLMFNLKNIGARGGDEVTQVYFRHVNSALPQPKLALCGFTRISLAPGEAARVAMDIPIQRFRYWDTTQEQYAVEPGDYELLVGAASDDIRLRVPVTIAAQLHPNHG